VSATDPRHLVQYTCEAPVGGVSLRHLAQFARRLEEIGAGSFLDHPIHGSLNQSVWVSGLLLDPDPAKIGGASSADVMGRRRAAISGYLVEYQNGDIPMSILSQMIGEILNGDHDDA
jgi:hypothetical protein